MDRLAKCPVTALTSAGGAGLSVEVAARPDAILFKGKQHGFIGATVCGKCGLVRLYGHNPQELLAAYRNAKERLQDPSGASPPIV